MIQRTGSLSLDPRSALELSGAERFGAERIHTFLASLLRFLQTLCALNQYRESGNAEILGQYLFELLNLFCHYPAVSN